MLMSGKVDVRRNMVYDDTSRSLKADLLHPRTCEHGRAFSPEWLVEAASCLS